MKSISTEKMGSYLIKYRHYLSILVLGCIFALVDYTWINRDTAINAFDMSGHLTQSLQFYDIWLNLSPEMFSRLIFTSTYYPPLIYVLTSLAYMVFGTSIVVARMTGVFFVVVIALCTFETGKRLYDEKTGLTAAFLITTYPIIFGLSRDYLLDLGLMAIFSVFLLVFVLSNGFKNRKASALLGLVAGTGMLTKWTFVFFMAGPGVVFLAYEAWRIWNKTEENGKDVLTNIIICLFALLAVSSIWYLPNFSSYWNSVLFNSDQGVLMRQDLEASLVPLLSYLFMMINNQLFLPLFAFFVAGTIAALLRRDQKALLMLAAFAVSYAIISLIRNKDIRYSIPLLIYVAIISSCWIYRLKDKHIKTAIVLLLVMVCPLQLLSAYDRPESQSAQVSTPLGQIDLLPHQVYTLRPPVSQDWKIEELALLIDNDYRSSGGSCRALVSVLPDNQYFAGPVFEYVTIRDELNFYPKGGYVWYPEEFNKDVLKADYVITKDGLNASSPGLKRYEDIVVSTFNDHIGDFEHIATIGLPDGTNATVYKRKT